MLNLTTTPVSYCPTFMEIQMTISMMIVPMMMMCTIFLTKEMILLMNQMRMMALNELEAVDK